MKNPNRGIAALLLTGASVAYLFVATPARAAPGAPVNAGSAGQTSGTGTTLTVTTTASIAAGDLIVVAAASASNQTPQIGGCSLSDGTTACSLSFDGRAAGFSAMGSSGPDFRLGPLDGYNATPGAGDKDPMRARVFFSYATASIPSGATFNVVFAGAIGAKAAMVLDVPSAQVSARIDPNQIGSGTSTSISCSPGNPVPASNLVLATSFVSGGGSDSYTEDAGFTFLAQTGAGAWPAIRVAYKLTSSSAVVPYTLTDASSRTWVVSCSTVK
jgi:hypothetical protein